ncbi:hypothetical protein BGX24_009032 [Mortierella sp. AD032]|nr:hypothetical protein BGX24_009032 [Mortierella sp. AD032]
MTSSSSALLWKPRVWATSISLIAAIGISPDSPNWHHSPNSSHSADGANWAKPHSADRSNWAKPHSHHRANRIHRTNRNNNNNPEYLPSSKPSSIVPTSTPSSNVSSSNLPVIIGSVAGAAALIIIIATTFICLRRKRRKNRDLTFDVLQGMNTGNGAGAGAAATSSYARSSQQHYRASALPPSNVSAYDDGYDYDSQVGGPGQGGIGGGYGHHQQGYDDTGYDSYGNPHNAYQNPSIFQEDSMAYSTANVMSTRNRAGYEQNLPEIVYRNGNDLIHPSGGPTGYYEDDLYNQQIAGANNGWENQNAAAGGYIGPKGLWVANPTTEKQYQQQQQQYQDEMELQPPVSSTMTYEKNSITQYDSDTAVDSSSPRSKFRGHNPQALPESPRTQQLRGGDLFGQDGGTPSTPTSPRATNASANASVDNVTRAASPPPAANSSPRLMSRADMRSFEMARHSPGRSSSDGVQSYANDLPGSTRPSISDRPSLEGGNGGSNLNPNKSLRTLRREDWS